MTKKRAWTEDKPKGERGRERRPTNWTRKLWKLVLLSPVEQIISPIPAVDTSPKTTRLVPARPDPSHMSANSWDILTLVRQTKKTGDGGSTSKLAAVVPCRKNSVPPRTGWWVCSGSKQKSLSFLCLVHERRENVTWDEAVWCGVSRIAGALD